MTAELVLLTGSSGFVGAHVEGLLLKRGYRLRTLTRKPNRLQHSVHYVVGDLTDGTVCRQAMKNVNRVIHIAGEKRDKAQFWSVNVQGTKNLLEAAADEGVNRFVHLSSIGVIGVDP
jgi:nucleoside-diphosphate-sugar epimerase